MAAAGPLAGFRIVSNICMQLNLSTLIKYQLILVQPSNEKVRGLIGGPQRVLISLKLKGFMTAMTLMIYFANGGLKVRRADR